MEIPDTAPFTPEQRAILNQLLPSMNPAQLQWLLGFAAGIDAALRQDAGAPAALQAQTAGNQALLSTLGQIAPDATATNPGPAPAAAPEPIPLTIAFGSESGNAESLADSTAKEARKRGFVPKVLDMGDTDLATLSKVGHLLIITSTWGDGDPPDNAVSLHSELMGENAPSFKGVQFSVCALGDTSYDKFCQTGKDFDQRLEELGGERLSERVDCDVDFDGPYQAWLEATLESLSQQVGPAPQEALAAAAAPAAAAVAQQVAAAQAPLTQAVVYDRKNPFRSKMKEKILLNGKGSKKEVWHYELSLAGSNITYQPGDSLAVLPYNGKDIVDPVLQAGSFISGSVSIDGGSQMSLGSALANFYDITTLTKNLLEKYNQFAESKKIDRLLADSDEMKAYIEGRQIVDMLEDFPVKQLSAKDFTSILRKLPPRLYSIASSLRAHPEEVHLTVAAVRYNTHGKERKGVASTYLADLVQIDGTVPIYVSPNKSFKLPEDNTTPIIMVGPGTGIAPFRAFVEERQALGATGKNWLFFGDQHYTNDFLYQLEWQDYLKDGLLTKLDVAFSRDQKKKVYVQHRMAENAKELWSWLDSGAYFYVCGDATRMAHDVHEALIDIVEKQGGLARPKAEAYVQQMQKDKRYLRDVY